MWLFQGVLNAGLQILLSIFGGWLCAWLKLVDPEVLSRQLNAFAMRAAFPAFIIHLLGVKTDLQDLEAWKALGVFILWVFLIHMCCIAWHKLRGGSSTAQTLGINCLLLTTNNTGCIGWPVLIATVGRQGAALSMLLGVLFFVQLLPAAITCFEYHKFLQEHQLEGSTSNNVAADESAAPEQALLPTTMGQAKQQKEEQAATGFPHEFRYCYWSNADYVPSKPAAAAGTGSSKDDVLAPAGDNARPYPNYVEVCVAASSKDANDDPEGEFEHHCYGGGYHGRGSSSSPGSSASSSTSGIASASSSQTPMTPRQQASAAVARAGSNAAAAAAAAKEWWRSGPAGRPKKPEAGLKRAKDSCDSLYTPFAVAVAGGSSSKEADMQQKPHVVQSPRAGGQLSNLTRRLSRGLGQQTTAAAAAAAAAASSAAGTLVRAASLKKQQQQQQRGSLAHMSVPLLSGHEGAGSCGGTTQTALATSSSVTLADLDAARRMSATGGASSSAAAGGGSSSMARASGAGEAAFAVFEAAGAEHFAAHRSQTIGLGIGAAASFAKAADSAIELHTMCYRASDGSKQHQHQHTAEVNYNPFEAHERQLQQQLAGGSSLSAMSAPIAAAASGPGSGALLLQNSSMAAGNSGTFLRGFGLGGSNARINSRTALLGLGSAPDSAGGAAATQPAAAAAAARAKSAQTPSSLSGKGKTKLSSVAHGAATAAGSAGASCVGDLEVKEEVVHHRGCFGAFMRNHPLLVHITAVQLKSFHLWLNVIAIALSVSGARKYLDADSPLALPALGWLDGVLGWFSSACIPVLLFANGVWMVGKDITGGKRGQIQVSLLLLLKLALLPALMVGLTQLFNMRGTYGLSLVLLSSCPLAPLAFLVCQQYGVGAELATSVTIQGVLLMLPQMMAVIKISQVAGLYDVDLLKAA